MSKSTYIDALVETFERCNKDNKVEQVANCQYVFTCKNGAQYVVSTDLKGKVIEVANIKDATQEDTDE